MKTIVVRKDSWHYWVLSRVTDGWILDDLDFCAYCRRLLVAVLLGGFVSLFALGLACGVLYCEFLLFWWGLKSLFTWTRYPIGELGLVAVVINVAAAICFYLVGLTKGWWRPPAVHKLIPSCVKIPLCPETRDFISHAWEAVHNKVCFKMEWKDK